MLPLFLNLASALLLFSGVLLAAMTLPFPDVLTRGTGRLAAGPLLRPRGPLRSFAGRVPDAAWFLAPPSSAAVFLVGAAVGFAPLPALASGPGCALFSGVPYPVSAASDWMPAVAIVFGTFALLVSVLAALAADDPHDPRLAAMRLSAAAMAPCGWTMAFVAYLGSLVPC